MTFAAVSLSYSVNVIIYLFSRASNFRDEEMGFHTNTQASAVLSTCMRDEMSSNTIRPVQLQLIFMPSEWNALDEKSLFKGMLPNLILNMLVLNAS